MNRIFSFSCSVLRIVYTTKQIRLLTERPSRLTPMFLYANVPRRPIQPIGIGEDCGGFLKPDAMFLEVGNGLRNVPRKHIIVYTLIARMSQD